MVRIIGVAFLQIGSRGLHIHGIGIRKVGLRVESLATQRATSTPTKRSFLRRAKAVNLSLRGLLGHNLLIGGRQKGVTLSVQSIDGS